MSPPSTSIAEAFPRLGDIDDARLRERVVRVWTRAIEDSPFDDVREVPWWPPLERRLEGKGPTTVEHVRDVTEFAASMADALARRGYDVDRDVVIAGALVHDVSKCYELDLEGTNERNEWLPHPHFSVAVLEAAGFSSHLQHVALAHSRASGVDPRSLEAGIVAAADRLAVDAVFWTDAGVLGP